MLVPLDNNITNVSRCHKKKISFLFSSLLFSLPLPSPPLPCPLLPPLPSTLPSHLLPGFPHLFSFVRSFPQATYGLIFQQTRDTISWRLARSRLCQFESTNRRFALKFSGEFSRNLIRVNLIPLHPVVVSEVTELWIKYRQFLIWKEYFW